VTFKTSVLRLVARIPRGRVATYGQVAVLVGRPRVSGMVTQRIRLEQEGVQFRRGRVVLPRFRWRVGGPRRLGGFAGDEPSLSCRNRT